MKIKYSISIVLKPLIIALFAFSSFSCLNDIKNVFTIKQDLNDSTSNFGKIELTQYTNILLKNPYFDTLEVYADNILLCKLTTNAQTEITLSNQKNLTFILGKHKVVRPLKIRSNPQIKITSFINSGDGVSLRQLQDSVCCRVNIIDDFPENLIVSFNGPITYNQIDKKTYDITLSFLTSEEEFNNWSKGKDSPYFINFEVNVKDKICPYIDVSQGESIKFDKW